MKPSGKTKSRRVKANYGLRKVLPDPPFEIALSRQLKEDYGQAGLKDLFSRFVMGEGKFDALMRRAILRALARKFGHGVQIQPGVGFTHAETFEIGNGVFIGAQAFIQGRHEGRCVIGNSVWIGPQSYFDARNLIIGDDVGWGPGAKVLGSTHSGIPLDVPIIATDLIIKPVRIGKNSDIGVNAVILPGVQVGKGSIVGAGAVVVEDVPPDTIVAGVPARVLRERYGTSAESQKKERT